MEKPIRLGRDSQYWDKIWYGLLVVIALVILNTFQSYGVTSDAHHHVRYGRDIAKWYTSLFTDHSVFGSVNTWLYGGFFDFTVYVLSLISPFDIHDTRHLYSAVIGLLGVVAAYRIGCVLGGKRAGVLAALCLILTPRYYGHAFNNTKDIPFAVFYLWGLYGLIHSLHLLPQLPRSAWVKLGVAIGLTMAIRANGAVLFLYVGIFWCLRLAQLSGGLPKWCDRRVLLRYVCVLFVAYAVLFPFWPWLHIHPLTGLWDGIVMFASFSEVHYSFFDGHYVGSDVIPWYYAPKWLLLTLPEFVIAGLPFAVVWFFFLLRQRRWADVAVLQWAVMGFGALFPLIYGVLSGTPLYDGLRQMLFVIPPFVIVCVVGFERCVSHVVKAQVRWCAWGLKAALILLVLWDMVGLHPNQYVYFNRAFAGGLPKAAPFYETDYWNHTYKQGIMWLEQQHRHAGQKPSIGSFYPNTDAMVDQARFFLVEPEDADFYLGNTRYDLHRMVPGNVIHTIDAQGVPLLYIIQPDTLLRADPFFDVSPMMHNRQGDVLRASGKLSEALLAYEKTLEKLDSGIKLVGLDSSGVLHKMGNVLLGMGQYDAALETFERIPDQDIFAGAVANNVGMYWVGKGAFEEALGWMEYAVAVAPDFYEANVSLGSLYMKFGDTLRAAAVFEKVSKGYERDAAKQFELGNLLYGLKHFEAAGVCFERVTRMGPDALRGYYYLGLAKSAAQEYADARDAFLRVVDKDPTHAKAYQSLAAAYMHLENFEAAAKTYERSIALVPNEGYLHTVLGIAQMNLRHYDAAKKAFDRALKLNPNDNNARRHLNLVQTMTR